MAKILIDVDEEALAKASEALGTSTEKDTVNTALREAVLRLERAKALVEMQELAARGGMDLDYLQDKRKYRR
ncbi:type II toxin-antitoxin system VapB family antitoxin [Marinactinospora rubrisoli]|uniref:Type II toxin-antitoxin system VapB family antitoxin n=1 Tax=Marinactinospora rubrisoli TaxID=2715399 RepID=A0ABW2KJJ4_9ACTN